VDVVLDALDFRVTHVRAHGETVTVQAAQGDPVEIHDLYPPDTRTRQHVDDVRTDAPDPEHDHGRFLQVGKLVLTEEFYHPGELLVLDVLIMLAAEVLLFLFFRGHLFVLALFQQEIRNNLGGNGADDDSTEDEADLVFAEHQQLLEVNFIFWQ